MSRPRPNHSFARPEKADRSEYVPFADLPDSHFGSTSHIEFLRHHYDRQQKFLDIALAKANFAVAMLDLELDVFEIQLRQSNIDRIEKILPLIQQIREELD